MKSNKFVRGIFGLILSCFVICGITSCTPPSGSPVATQITYLDAVEGVPAEFVGTLENVTPTWTSEYILSKKQISDLSMGVVFNVVSDQTVTSADGYTLVFCQVAQGKGTEYTKEGYFYAIGIKKNGAKIDICCPADYSSVVTSLDKLKEKYTAEYNLAANGNYYTSCDKVPDYRTAVEGVPDSFLGTWENNDYGYHSEYAVSKTQINDGMSNVLYNVVSTSTVTTTDGYILVFCQVAEGSGTSYTPAGNYYVVGLKLSGDNLTICCPLDYSSVYKTLGSLTKKYTSAFTYAGSGNYDSVCTKMNAASSQKVTVTSNFFKIEFEKNNIILSQSGASGFTVTNSFDPIKESKGGTDLYLRSNNYYQSVSIKTISGQRRAVFYSYDEDEGDEFEEMTDWMPTVSDEQLAAIKALYE